jgi:hypothetical protein
MVLLWIIQLLINCFVVAFVLHTWRQAANRKFSHSVASPVDTSALLHWEREVLLCKKKTDDQLRALSLLCEKAQAILGTETEVSPSREEEELKSIRSKVAFVDSKRMIPSIQELEIKKASLKTEIPLDLRKVLRDQLS